MKEEQEKLKERVRECDGDGDGDDDGEGDGGGVLRNPLGELSHGGHMRSGKRKRVLRVVKSGEGDDGHAKETKPNEGGGGY